LSFLFGLVKKGEVGDVSNQQLRDTGFVSFEEVIPSETVGVERVLPGPREE